MFSVHNNEAMTSLRLISPHPNLLPWGEGTAGGSLQFCNDYTANNIAGFSRRLRAILPLPKGEGRGEGKENSFLSAKVNSYAPVIERFIFLVALSLSFVATCARSADTNYPPPIEKDFILHDFHFRDGESLPEIHMHYLTLGQPQRDKQGVVRNAVLILHGTTGSSAQFLRPEFADELYGKGQPLDVTRYYLIIPDNIGHGKSSKPSDGLRAKFPNYGYRDMIEAQYRLLTEGLNVNHLRLVMGTSMGGMHAWLWGEIHPDFMDALMPLGSLPDANFRPQPRVAARHH